MANDKASDRGEALTDRPSEVQITVTVTGLPRERPFREQGASSAGRARVLGRAIAAAAILIAASLIIAAPRIDSTGVRGGTGRSYATIAAAYPYPSRGLLVKISTTDRSYARADVTRRSGCGRYCGYDGVILHRVSGSWRVVLQTATYSCPVASLPPRVQAELAVCALK